MTSFNHGSWIMMEHVSWVTEVAPPGGKLILAYMWYIYHISHVYNDVE